MTAPSSTAPEPGHASPPAPDGPWVELGPAGGPQGPDWALIAGWALAAGILVLVAYGFVEAPLVDLTTNRLQLLRVLRALLVLPLVVLLTYLLLTRSRSAEQRDAEARLLLLLGGGTLLLTDARGIIVRTNPAPETILGYGRSELVGRPIRQLFAPEARSRIDAWVPASGRVETVPAPTVLRGLRKDGVTVAVEVAALGRRIRGRRTVAFRLRDVSEREELVQALAGRGAELARSNRDLEQFAYVASHDLQEPIRMVASFSQLLQERYAPQLDDQGKEFLGYVHQGALRMRELVDALLAYARVDTRGEPFRAVSLEKVLGDALLNLHEAVRASGAVVSFGRLPTVEGDATQLVQLLQNLVGNAIKFHGPDRPTVRVEAERLGPEWTVSVRDNGIGIPPAYHDRIFGIFQRLHTREEYEGSGIGLAVCKRVVERHGGRIWVESTGRPGDGTTVHFTLPAERAAPVPSAPAEPSADAAIRRAAQSMIENRLKDLI